MLTLHVLAPVVAGVTFLLVALFYLVLAQRRRSPGYRWYSLVYVALALCAGFTVVGQLTNTPESDVWSDLTLAALFVAGCAVVVGLVSTVRENRRRAGMQQ